jgi:hypothetical protein
MPVVFEAGPDAPIGAGLVPVTVRSYGQVPTIVGEFEQTVDLVAATKDRLYQGVNVNRLAMAVVEPAPYRIRLEQPPTALPRDGSLELIVHVERDNGFDGTIDVTIPFLPTWVDGPDKITIASDQTTGKFALRTHPDVTIGSWPTVAEGVPGVGPRPSPEDRAAAATGQAARRPRRRGPRGSNAGHAVASQLLPLTITESPLTGGIGPLLATPGRTIDVKIQLARSGEVPQTMTASLQGLPVRVEADAVTVSVKDRELNFKVRLAQDAPLGEFPGLLCELTGEWDGHKVSYRVGRGGSLKIVKPSELVVDESGRPLSPLEILRKQPFGTADQAADASSR